MKAILKNTVTIGVGPAGTGKTYAAGFPRPYLLAGGLTPANAADAIRAARPWGLDASSSLETAGLKDPAKIRAFVSAIRACQP